MWRKEARPLDDVVALDDELALVQPRHEAQELGVLLGTQRFSLPDLPRERERATARERERQREREIESERERVKDPGRLG
jgi:hypothetical protein